jgi:hypothetical protein
MTNIRCFLLQLLTHDVHGPSLTTHAESSSDHTSTQRPSHPSSPHQADGMHAAECDVHPPLQESPSTFNRQDPSSRPAANGDSHGALHIPIAAPRLKSNLHGSRSYAPGLNVSDAEFGIPRVERDDAEYVPMPNVRAAWRSGGAGNIFDRIQSSCVTGQRSIESCYHTYKTTRAHNSF